MAGFHHAHIFLASVKVHKCFAISVGGRQGCKNERTALLLTSMGIEQHKNLKRFTFN